jgi:hypothetical protein
MPAARARGRPPRMPRAPSSWCSTRAIGWPLSMQRSAARNSSSDVSISWFAASLVALRRSRIATSHVRSATCCATVISAVSATLWCRNRSKFAASSAAAVRRARLRCRRRCGGYQRRAARGRSPLAAVSPRACSHTCRSAGAINLGHRCWPSAHLVHVTPGFTG